MSDRENTTDTFVLFELAGATYGVRSSDVRQLEMIEHITPVPNASEIVEGVVFSRGQVIPALSLRARFGFEKIPYDISTRLLVVGVGDRSVGLIVDSARQFKSIRADRISPPPDGLADLSGQYLEAVANVEDNTILILNMAEVIRTDLAGTETAES
jgi:purine-binding chemotaxis protein CheW